MCLRGLGASISDIHLPPLALYSAAATLIARGEGFAIHEKTLRERPQDYGALARDRLTIGAYVRASDMVQAMRQRRMLGEATKAAMAGIDAILLPTVPDPAPKLGELGAIFQQRAAALHAAVQPDRTAGAVGVQRLRRWRSAAFAADRRPLFR